VAEELDVVIIGAGQAGLSLSHELGAAGIEHVVLERGRVGQSWRGRWDSFCLVLPNWTIRMPGGEYHGADPDGFMGRDEFVAHIEAYTESFSAPVREGVAVDALTRDDVRGGFRLSTTGGEIHAREAVVATGAFQRPYRPAPVQELAKHVPVLDSGDYRNPSALPDGRILVIGSGQTGCQIAEELREAGRDVVLSCGRAPWQPRRIGNRDAFAWVADSPLMAMTAGDLPSPMARFGANPQASGRDGGHDLHYRTLQAMDVTLAGHLVGCEGGRVVFAADLADSVAFGDARYADLAELVARQAANWGVAAPELPLPPRFVADGPADLQVSTIGAAILTSGYRPDYARWMQIPGAFDDMGFPLQRDGSSTVAEGLHFMGVHFQRTRASATLYGVGGDARALAERMVTSRQEVA
jgi:cation diffusion facilitator CzcD-associated flavoprotein CzcO